MVNMLVSMYKYLCYYDRLSVKSFVHNRPIVHSLSNKIISVLKLLSVYLFFFGNT